jgi:hypothetical protein
VKDNEVLDALVDDVVGALASPPIPNVARVLRSTSAEDLIFRDTEGQLPAIGVVDVGIERGDSLGVSVKRFKGRVEIEICLAAPAEGESATAARDTIRALLGEVNKRIDFRPTPVNNLRFQFLGFSYAEQQRETAVVAVLRYVAGAYFGNE